MQFKIENMSNFGLFLISMPGGGEWILIILAVILLFGGKKIPELMKGIGEGMKEFKKSMAPENDAKKKEDEKIEK